MSDLLVPLYKLKEVTDIEGIWIGRPLPHQAPVVLKFVSENFGSGWNAEATAAFASTPPNITVAVDEETGAVVGFCCHNCTALGFLGPIGVSEEVRGRGVGKAVVLKSLHAMKESGYGYAVIGYAGPVEFFRKFCDARIIEGSSPGIYENPIKK